MNHANTNTHRLTQKTLMVWLAVALLASFAFSMQSLKDPVSMVVMPEAPQQGEPLTLSFTLHNPALAEETYSYELYINGELAMQGESPVGPMSSKQHKYIYQNPLSLGEQTTFLIKAKTSSGEVIQKTLSIPVYAPQVWTSFVSMATYSTVDYNAAFAPTKNMNVGLIFTLVLIPMLSFLVLTEPYAGKSNTLGRLNHKFTRLSAIMFVIFMGMVLTHMVMIIGRL